MTRIEASVMIDRSAEDVWNFITDTSNAPKWDEGVAEWKQTSAGPLGVGTTFEATELHPKLTYSERVVEYEPNRKLSLEITSGPAKGTIGTLSIEPFEGKARLTESSEYSFAGFYKLLGPFLSGKAKRETTDRVANVKRILESKVDSTAVRPA